MHGVGQGSTLDGRYVLHRRIQTRPTFERWTATDQTLERPVIVLCLPADLPHTPAVLDAARRAAGIDDPRLVRVHDVGQDRGVAFIVEEDPAPAEPLLSTFRSRALPGPEVRRLVGEAASTLEIARTRGLHHLALTPADVLLRDDGSIVIRGLETKAALLGLDGSDSDRASRADAVSLVALAYAGLTTRWPLPEVAGAPSGMDQAPSFVGGIPAPSEIAAGIPADLDVLARQTFGSHLGPLTPGDLARQIAPWGHPWERSEPRTEPAADQTGVGGSGHLSEAGADPRAQASPVNRATGGGPGDDPSVGASPVGAPVAPPSVVAASLAATSGLVSRTGTRLREAATSGAESLSAARARARATRATRATRDDVTGAGEATEPPYAIGTVPGPQPTASGPGHAGGPSGPRQPSGPPASVDDRPLSILPESTALAPTRGQATLAIAIVAGSLVIVTVLALFNLPGMGVAGAPEPTAATPRATAKTPPTTAPAPRTSTTAAPVAPIRIVAALGFDPQGDGTEGSDSAARALDGSATTSWRSEWYLSASYSNLKKGVGLALDLGRATAIHQVVVTLPATQDVTVYAAPRLSLTDAVLIGSGTNDAGSTTVTVTGAPPSARYVIVWVTRPAADGGGRFRAQISDVAVR